MVFRKVDKEDKKYQKDLKQKLKLKTQGEKVDVKPKNKLALFFQKLCLRKKRSEIVKVKQRVSKANE